MRRFWIKLFHTLKKTTLDDVYVFACVLTCVCSNDLEFNLNW